MLEEQTIWLSPKATAFTAVCDACLGEQAALEGFLAATVAGSLRLEDSHGWAECRQGHRIRVERVDPILTGVIRS